MMIETNVKKWYVVRAVSGQENKVKAYIETEINRLGMSDYISQDDESLILKLFPLAKIKTIPNATHWVHADAPKELCRLLSVSLGKECAFDQ